MEKQERATGIGMLIFIFILLMAILFIGWRYFRVSKIEVEGNVNVDTEYIAKLTGIKLDQNLFAISPDKVKLYINSDPYLEYYGLKRIYPSTVRVEVYERIPVAVLKGDGYFYVLDNQANVLKTMKEADASLVLIKGLEGFKAVPGEKLETATPYQFDALTAILIDVKYKELSEAITMMDMSDINDIKMRTKVGFIVEFGQAENVTEKIVWINKAIKELTENNIRTGTINVVAGNSATYSE